MSDFYLRIRYSMERGPVKRAWVDDGVLYQGYDDERRVPIVSPEDRAFVWQFLHDGSVYGMGDADLYASLPDRLQGITIVLEGVWAHCPEDRELMEAAKEAYLVNLGRKRIMGGNAAWLRTTFADLIRTRGEAKK